MRDSPLTIHGESPAVAKFTQAWAKEIRHTSYVSMNFQELTDFLAKIVGKLVSALESASPMQASVEIAYQLIDTHFTGPATIGQTIRIIGDQLAELGTEIGVSTAAVTDVQGGLAAGFARGLRDRVLVEQEQILRASIDSARDAERRLTESEIRFRTILDEVAIGVCIVDTNGRLRMTNKFFLDMFEAPRDVVAARISRSIADPNTDRDPDYWREYQRVMRGEQDHLRTEKNYFRRDGRIIWTQQMVSLVRDANGQPQYIVAFIEDISHRHEFQQQLRRQATYDPITELPNRRLLFEHIGGAIASTVPGSQLGICTIDIDQFKAVNDTLGHDAGDELLARLARRLEACVIDHGHFLAHVGGDEFVVLINKSTGAKALGELAEALLAVVEKPIPLKGIDYPVSVTIGVTERPAKGLQASELIRDGDLTLSWAKANAPGRWALGNTERNNKAVDRYELSTALPGALKNDEFFLEYQPLVDLATGIVVGAESLIRWQHPQRGRISPETFIHLAEETGIIGPLGRWVLAESCQQARLWQEEFGDRAPFISVNLAVRQLRNNTVTEDVTTVLERTGLVSEKLQLELTESAIMGPGDASLQTLWSLANMGISLAIDDFGTGYSNLAYLKRLPVRSLKLAGSFVEGLRSAANPDPVDYEIVTAMISLAHALGLSVTAEGIETVEQASRLRDVGCDLGQGWLFSKPTTASHVAELARMGTPVQ